MAAAAKLLALGAKAMEEEIGDSTNLVIILAGARADGEASRRAPEGERMRPREKERGGNFPIAKTLSTPRPESGMGHTANAGMWHFF